VCVCERERERERVCVCVCERERERERESLTSIETPGTVRSMRRDCTTLRMSLPVCNFFLYIYICYSYYYVHILFTEPH